MFTFNIKNREKQNISVQYSFIHSRICSSLLFSVFVTTCLSTPQLLVCIGHNQPATTVSATQSNRRDNTTSKYFLHWLYRIYNDSREVNGCNRVFVGATDFKLKVNEVILRKLYYNYIYFNVYLFFNWLFGLWNNHIDVAIFQTNQETMSCRLSQIFSFVSSILSHFFHKRKPAKSGGFYFAYYVGLRHWLRTLYWL